MFAEANVKSTFFSMAELVVASPIRGCFESLQHRHQDASASVRTSTNHIQHRHACALVHRDRTDCCRSRIAGVNGASVSAAAVSEETYLSYRKILVLLRRRQNRSDGMKMFE